MNYLRALPKEKLQKVILILLVSVIATVAIGVFYANAQYNLLSERRQKIAELKRKILDVQGRAKTERQGAKSLEEVQAFIEAQSASLVADDPLSWSVRQIRLLEEQYPGVRVITIRPSGRAPHRLKNQYEAYHLQLEFDGAYDELGTFVKALENKFPTGEIRQLELLAADEAGTTRRLNLSLSLLMLPPAKETKPDAQPQPKAGPAA